MPYKLTVVKASDGSYLVGGYYKAGEEKLDDFEEAIEKIKQYNSIVFQEEPCLIGLTKEEETEIRSVRAGVLNT